MHTQKEADTGYVRARCATLYSILSRVAVLCGQRDELDVVYIRAYLKPHSVVVATLPPPPRFLQLATLGRMTPNPSHP